MKKNQFGKQMQYVESSQHAVINVKTIKTS